MRRTALEKVRGLSSQVRHFVSSLFLPFIAVQFYWRSSLPLKLIDIQYLPVNNYGISSWYPLIFS